LTDKEKLDRIERVNAQIISLIQPESRPPKQNIQKPSSGTVPELRQAVGVPSENLCRGPLYIGTPYIFTALVTAEYETVRFNSSIYLDSISVLTVRDGSAENEREGRRVSEADKRYIEWRVCIPFSDKPQADRLLVFSIGPIKWSVKFGQHSWTPYSVPHDTSSRFFRTAGTIDFKAPDPTWPMLHSPRLLRTKQDSVSLLEAIVENRSNDPVPLSYMLLRAEHPNLPDIWCGQADPLQKLTLDWDRLIATSGAEGVWTNVADMEVRVDTKFSGKGFYSPFFFEAAIPVNLLVGPHQASRVQFLLNEVPQVTGNESLGLKGGPMDLAQWGRVELGAYPSGILFPQMLKLPGHDAESQIPHLAVTPWIHLK
jgi:hypothetical protein